MTDPKPQRAKRNTVPIKGTVAIGKILDIAQEQDADIAAATRKIVASNRKRIRTLFDLVPREQQDGVRAMLAAVSVEIPVIDAESAEAEEPPPATDTDAGEVPERLRDPLPPERLAVGRKR